VSNIEWTEKTWNPVVGCKPVSPGCLNCYAATMARRLEAMGRPEYAPRPREELPPIRLANRFRLDGVWCRCGGEIWYDDGIKHGTTSDKSLRWEAFCRQCKACDTNGYSSQKALLAESPAFWGDNQSIRIAEVCGGRAVFTGDVRTVESRLTDPLTWRKPSMVFVNSMSDLFHEAVPFEFIDKVFAVMALCQQHAFQCLSKRPERMVEYFNSRPLDRIAALLYNATHEQGTFADFKRAVRDRFGGLGVAGGETARERREARRRVLPGSEDQSVPTSAGGISNQRRLPTGGRDNQWKEGRDGRTPFGVASPARPDQARTDDQPQERREVRQPTGQSGASYTQRAAEPRDQSSGGETPRRTRVETPKDTSDGSRCFGNATAAGERLTSEGNRGTVPDDDAGDVGNLLPQDLAAHLAWPLPNVWLGASAEDQDRLDERVPHLLKCPAAVRFLSLEPLLGPMDLRKWFEWGGSGPPWIMSPSSHPEDAGPHNAGAWVIVGGESGHGARPCDVGWIKGVVRQCAEAGVPCFVKQLGASVSGQIVHPDNEGYGVNRVRLIDRKGGDPAEWPEDLRVRQFPEVRT